MIESPSPSAGPRVGGGGAGEGGGVRSTARAGEAGGGGSGSHFAHSSAGLTVGDAMDAVAAQCERRGLTSAATWLGEMSLRALPAVLSTPVPSVAAGHGGRSSSLVAVLALDDDVADAMVRPSSNSTAARATWRRLHRVALGYFTKGEFQRCHSVLLREAMRNTAACRRGADADADGDQSAADALDGGGLAVPPPEVVRGLRTTIMPSQLQFLCLYALFMEGMKAKQLSSSSSSGSGGPSNGGGGGGGGPQRALHPHARVLRAYLVEALRNPVNVLPCLPNAAPSSGGGGGGGRGDHDGDVHHTPVSRPSWTTSSASRWTSGAAAAARRVVDGGVVDGVSPSTAASSAFSNASPAGSPAIAAPPAGAAAAGGGSAVASEPVADAPGADLLRSDPYLVWLMGVVLRELFMRQESATFLLAAVTVNPLLRCAWEDLACLVSRESQLVELDAALDGVEPAFMADLFAAEVRGLLGMTPVSSARLRAAAAAALASAGDGAAPTMSPTGPPLSAASATAMNSTLTASTRPPASSALPEDHPITAKLSACTSPLPPPPPPPPPASSLSPSTGAAALANAWECLSVLFPDTPFVLSQLARFYYHQRSRLDRAEALYQRIRAIDPHYFAILFDYSNLLYTKRDRLGLSSLVQSVYHADAFRAETNFAVGNYYVLLGQHDRAALHFLRTTAIDPQCAEAWLLLGHAYVEGKNTTAAVEAYRTAVSLNERDYRGWYNLGQLYELLEAYHHALYYYWHTTSLRPADPGMWVAVANCLEHDGRTAESIACLERAETYDSSSAPGYPAYVRRIATYHIAKSSFTRACVYLEKLAQSPAATTEDLLLALPFIIQHYIQRARNSVDVFLRTPMQDPMLFSPGAASATSSPPSSSSVSTAAAGSRTALYHARAAAALQHLHKAEEHLGTVAELVAPSPAGHLSGSGELLPATSAATATGGGGAENSAPPPLSPERHVDSQRGRPPRGGPSAPASTAAAVAPAGGGAPPASPQRPSAAAAAALAAVAASATPNTGDLPLAAFVRSRHQEIGALRVQAMHLLHSGMAVASGSAATQPPPPPPAPPQPHVGRHALTSQLLGRHQ
ncbi:Anaphase promoting complex subunit 8 / Cdc23/Tetratricopeptide repeat/TPR repeat [Novymonas esmeraldas]|uniref:Anaphase promoting complex subunit 8 / Cdc23/Tetratricopeptide repeat/TPR repeat n=1 Tax=Novymonas esmeraldas TaxID=1808958 RepID=A0AAW0FAA0_9TRYP